MKRLLNRKFIECLSDVHDCLCLLRKNSMGSYRLLYHIVQSKTQLATKILGIFYGYRVGKHIELSK